MVAAKQRAGLEWVILVAMYCLIILPDAPRRAERYLANKEYRSGLARQPTVQRIGLAESLVLGKRADTLFVDARPEAEFARGHIPGAVLADGTLDERIRTGGYSNIVVYCSGPECVAAQAVAARILEKHPISVFIYGAGFGEWQATGMKVTDIK